MAAPGCVSSSDKTEQRKGPINPPAKSDKGMAYEGKVVRLKDGCYFRWAPPKPPPEGEWKPPPPKKVKCW